MLRPVAKKRVFGIIRIAGEPNGLMGTFGDDEESDCSDEVREICR